MAWPYDTRDKSYGAQSSVPSSNLNAIQDEIINLAGTRTIMLSAGFAEAGAWDLNSTPTYGWINTGGGYLMIPIPGRGGSVISEVGFKCNSTGAGSWTFDLHRVNMRILADTTSAPSVPVATDGSAPSPGAVGWFVEVLSGGNLPATLSLGYQWMAVISAPNAGDMVAGIGVTFTQMY